MRTIHSPESPLDCCSLAGLNRASLSNLAPVWSVIVRQEGDVWGGGGGSIWVIRWMYGLSLSGKKGKCVCVAGGAEEHAEKQGFQGLSSMCCIGRAQERPGRRQGKP